MFLLEPLSTPPEEMEECMWEWRSSGCFRTPESTPPRHSSEDSSSGLKSTDSEWSDKDWDDSSGQSEVDSSDLEVTELMEMMEDLELELLPGSSSDGHVSSASFIEQTELRYLQHRFRLLRKKKLQLAQRKDAHQCAFGPALEGPSSSKARGPVASSNATARPSGLREKGKDARASSKRSAPSTLETSSTPKSSKIADVGTATLGARASSKRSAPSTLETSSTPKSSKIADVGTATLGARASSKRSAPSTLETSSTPKSSKIADVGTATLKGPSSGKPKLTKPRRSAAKRVS